MKRYLIFIIIILFSGCDKLSNDNTDEDNDGIKDSIDNCIEIHNPDQKDTDGDSIGDVCDPDNYDGPKGDPDEDGVYNKDDNCPNVYNPGQDDDDNDGVGNLCDSDWVDPNGDLDGDGIPNNVDSCPNDYNKGTDYDNDGIDDACDPPPPEYTLTFGLYDDFDGMGCEQTYDGSQMAVDGSLSNQLWRHLASEDISVVDLSTIIGDSVSYGANPSGNVVKLITTDNLDIRFELIYPEKIDFIDFYSFSADILLVDVGFEHINFNLDFHTSIPEQPPGMSWWAQIRLMIYTGGWVSITGQYSNKNTQETNWVDTPAILNTWYNVRMDIVRIQNGDIRLDYYINGEQLGSLFPNDSEILFDPSRLLFGPKRSFEFRSSNATIEKQARAYIDNVKAVYRNRIQ